MNQNKFNISRCWSLLKGDLLTHSTDIALTAGTVCLIFIAVALLSLISPTANAYSNIPDAPFSLAEARGLTALGNIGLVLLVAEVVVYSRVFSNMSTRSGEISFLGLPATNGEKWLSRVLYVLLVGYVLMMAVYYLAILICMLAGHVLHVESLTMMGRMALDSSYVLQKFHLSLHWQAWMVNISTAFLIFAAFVLGGTWFRRLPWLYTALIVMATFFVVTIAGGFAVGYYVSGHEELAEPLEGGDISAFLNMFSPLFIAGAVGCIVVGGALLWLSFRLFCRRQLAARKFRFIS